MKPEIIKFDNGIYQIDVMMKASQIECLATT